MPLSQQDTLEDGESLDHLDNEDLVSMPLSQQDTLEELQKSTVMMTKFCLNAAFAARYS